VPAFLGSLDVAVLCSRSEGMSNAILEYMAAGRPIVATLVGANSQLIENEQTGLLVPPGDPSRLAGAICRLLRDPGWAAQLGAAARRRCQENYSRERSVRRFEDFFLALASRAGGGL
jgi:L-malate glycosyltransferase